MSDDAYGATVAKRQLSRRLTELRHASGHTANHVCDLLDWGRGKVGRFEANQWKRPDMSDIRDLLRIYGVDALERERIEQLAMKARIKPWWRDYSEVFQNEFPGFENDAARIRIFMPLLIPGLLQTRDIALRYARLWQQHRKSDAWLAPAEKLAAFRALDAAEIGLPPEVRSYIDRSQWQARRTTRIKRAAVGLIAALAVAASIGAWVALRNEREAEYQTARALNAQVRLLTETADARLATGNQPAVVPVRAIGERFGHRA